ncbi:unnamed protein product, partial [Prorocentrum cordatum]
MAKHAQPTLPCFLKLKVEPSAAPGSVVVKTEPGGDPGSGASSASSLGGSGPLSSDKAKYNKFNYRLKLCGDEYKDYYKKLVKSKDQAAIDTFVTDLIEMGANLPSDYLVRKRKVVEEKEHDDFVEWVPWAKAAEREGHECLLEMVQAGTVLSRKNPKLPADSKIEFPFNQQVKQQREVEHKKNKTIDERENATHEAVTSDGSEAFLKEFTHASIKANSVLKEGSGNPPTTAPVSVLSGASVAGSGTHPPDDPKVKVAIQAIRRSHNVWDRSLRDFAALVQKSKDHPNTQGCKFEKDLESISSQGDLIDKKLVSLEQKYMNTGTLDDDDIKLGAEQVSAIQDVVKQGNKRATALRPWFK